METVNLKTSPRTAYGKGPARRLRAQSHVPAVAYGGGTDTLNLSVAHDDLRAILTSQRGRNSLIELQLEGGKALSVMLRDYDVHPVSRRLLHADFVTVDVTKPLEFDVPFRTIGKSRGEAAGGTLLCAVRVLRVRCLPTQIPAVVEHDVSALEIDDVLRAKDLALPEGIEVLVPPERKVVVVVPPRVLEEKPAEEGAPVEGAEAAAGEEGAEGEKGEKGEKGAKKD